MISKKEIAATKKVIKAGDAFMKALEDLVNVTGSVPGGRDSRTRLRLDTREYLDWLEEYRLKGN